MRLNQLVAKPQLIKFTLEDQETIDTYGEPLEFYSWDRQPMSTFMKLASGNNEPGVIMDILKDMILDENGKAILVDENVLPTDVLIKVMNRMTEVLGK